MIIMVLHWTETGDFYQEIFKVTHNCGKTTVAKLLGNILAKLGVLPTNNFTIVKRTDFVGRYLGQNQS